MSHFIEILNGLFLSLPVLNFTMLEFSKASVTVL